MEIFMRILLVSPRTTDIKGGIAVWTEHYLQVCSLENMSCTVVNTAQIKDKNNRVRCLKNEFIRTCRIFRQLKEALSADNYDVAHLNTNVGFLGIIRDYLIAKKISKKHIPIVVQFHCDIKSFVKNSVIKYFLKKLIALSKKQLVLCESSVKYLNNNFSVNVAKIPNFISEDLIAQQKDVSPQLKEVVFAGRVSLSKGAKEIFEIAAAYPLLHFCLIGPVANEIKEWKKPDNVDLLGPMEHKEVISMLDKADLFLFPSHSEGFSIALAESMARGLPVVATDVGAAEDMLENKGGFVVKPKDVDGLKKALADISPYECRKQMSDWNIEKVKNSYACQKVLEQMLQEYKSIQ